MTLLLNQADLLFLFDNVLAGDTPPPGTDPFSLVGIRTIDGTNNNISHQTIVDQHGNVVDTDTFGNLNQAFIHLTSTSSSLAYAAASSNPMDPGFMVVDTSPRIVSNLIADDSANNPATAGIDMKNAGDLVNDILPFNSLFTLFGQFFDHGLDFVAKGGNGVVAIPLLPTDPLFDNAPGAVNMMFLSRATRDGNGDEINTTAPFIEQSQTYGSHEATSFFLKEYDVNGEMTGDLVHGEHGLATWADVKANALQWAVAQAGPGDPVPTEMLTDEHIFDIPDPTMWDVATASFLPGAGTGQSFLADIAHNANPDDGAGGMLTADGDSIINPFGFGAPPPASGEYDNELLDAHFIAGDPRANENAGLTAIHQAFHDEHTRLVNQLKDWVSQQDQIQPGFEASWTGEMYFQAAKVVNEMQYQHMVFEEFGRRMSPNIDLFSSYDVNINPNISAEFAHAVYRLGHSMQTENVRSANAIGEITDDTLIDAFLNPILFAEKGGADFLKGAQLEQGQEIDEFVVNGLRNFLVGLPLDLAALNIARGRETGLGSLNQTRADLFAQTGDASLQEYDSWNDFGAGLQNSASLVNFIAAYSRDATIAGLRNSGDLTGARAEAQDKIDNDATFMGVGGDQGFWDIDLWMGGLAEAKVPLGMLGSTFDFIFAQQMIALQNGDRFYYLARVAGTNILDQIESHTFADIMSRSTGAEHLNGDAFGFADTTIELSSLMVDDHSASAGYVSEIIGGNNNDNDIEGGEGNDSIYGEGGDDELNGGANDDHVYGGDGDDVIFGEVGFDFLRGDAGDDEIHGGADDDGITGGTGDDLLFGDQGFDALLGNAGNDEIHGGNQDDEIIGGAGDDTLFGDNGDDEIIGAEGNDLIFGGSGDDRITGDDGDDVILGGAGADRVDGGLAGYDIMSYESWLDSFASGAVSGLTVDMLDPALGTGDARDDSYDEIEAVHGSKHNDSLLGDDLDNVLVGGEGDDLLNGRLGNDTLVGGDGDDNIQGDDGIDMAVFRGNRADFTLTGGVGSFTVEHTTTGAFDDGTDTVSTNVELLAFDDMIIDVSNGNINVPLVGLSNTHEPTYMVNGVQHTKVGEAEADATILDGTPLSGAQGVKVADIIVSDPDGVSGVRTITLTGRDAAMFQVVGGTALHLVGGGPLSQTNFEVHPIYNVTVNVTDASGTSAINYTLNVEDVNDNAPVITSGNRVNVQENADAIHVLYRPESLDHDTTGEAPIYSISGADAGFFDFTNGELRFNNSMDFEAFADADGDNVFDVNIEATDGTNVAAFKALSVHLTDVVDSVNGDGGNNTLVGEVGDETFHGFGGDDEIEGRGGNDIIDGGDDTDTAVYRGAVTDYSFDIIDTNGTLQVTDNRTGLPAEDHDGVDTLTNVELFEFDGTPGTFLATNLFTNAPVVEDTPADLGSTAEDSVGFIISSTDMINGAFDINGQVLSVANVSVPPGKGTITFLNSSMGVDFYNYVPAANDDTDVVISFDVTDGTNFTPYSATLDLTPVDDAPIAGAPVVLAAFDEDTSRIITNAELVANTTEVDGDTLTASNVVLTSGTGSIVDNTDGTWTYTPDANDDADASFSFDVSDGISTISTTATLDITAVNDPPVAIDDTVAADEDVATTYTAAELLGNDTDVEGDVLTIASVASGSNGTAVLNMDGTVTFTSDADFNGVADFTYVANDGTDDSATAATVTVNVAAVNDAPVAVDDTVDADEDVATTYTAAEILGNDMDVEGDTLTIASVTSGANGTAVLNMDGTVTFTSDADFSGVADFTYVANDGALDSAPATVTVNVAETNDAPTANDDTVAATEDTAITYTAAELLGNDSDPENDTLTIASVMSGVGGTAVLNLDGTVTFTPDADFSGDATFTYVATDGTLDSDPAIVTVEVAPVNDAPIVNTPVASTASEDDAAFSVDLLAGTTDPDGDTMLVAGLTLLAGNSSGVMTNANALDIDPSAYNSLNDGESEVIAYEYQVLDLNGGSAMQTATITINGVNDAAVIGGDTSGTAGEDGFFASATIGGVLTSADVDDDDNLFTAATAAAAYGTWAIDTAGAWSYEVDNANTDVDAMSDGDILFDSFDVMSADGTIQTISIDIQGAHNRFTGTSIGETLIGTAYEDIIDGLGGNDILMGTGGDDELHGGAGNDRLHGDAGNDLMVGGTGDDWYYVEGLGDVVMENAGEGTDFIFTTGSNQIAAGAERLVAVEGATAYGLTARNFQSDILIGNSGTNVFVDQFGRDIFVGGGGADYFRFIANLDAVNNVNRINDFDATDDQFQLLQLIYTEIDVGILSADHFVLGTAANDADDRIVYDSSVGKVYYDPDGTGATAQIEIVNVTIGTVITEEDFQIF